MSSSVVVTGAWDFASYGTCSLKLTDDVVTNASISFSSGYYEHGSFGVGGYCTAAGVTSPALSLFGDALATALTAASPTRTYQVTWDDTTAKYTITTDEGVVFDLVLSGAAGTRMKQLTGLNPSTVHSGTTYTSTWVPWYAILPAKPGIAKYRQPQKLSGTSKITLNDAGDRYVTRRLSIPRMASWEHQYEPKERVDRDYLDGIGGATSTHLYTWEDLWSDFGAGQFPIGIHLVGANGDVEEMAFSLETPDYDESVCQRVGNYDDKFTIAMRARLWPGATLNTWARALS